MGGIDNELDQQTQIFADRIKALYEKGNHVELLQEALGDIEKLLACEDAVILSDRVWWLLQVKSDLMRRLERLQREI